MVKMANIKTKMVKMANMINKTKKRWTNILMKMITMNKMMLVRMNKMLNVTTIKYKDNNNAIKNIIKISIYYIIYLIKIIIHPINDRIS